MENFFIVRKTQFQNNAGLYQPDKKLYENNDENDSILGNSWNYKKKSESIIWFRQRSHIGRLF